MNDDGVVEVTLHVAAQPETVFPYFTDPGRYAQWMGSDATLESVPGGCYRVRMRDGLDRIDIDGDHVRATRTCDSCIAAG